MAQTTSRTQALLEDLRLRIESGYHLIQLLTYEEDRWTHLLGELCSEMDLGFITWSESFGTSPALPANSTSPMELLGQMANAPRRHVFLLKDLHPHLKNPAVVRMLRDVLPTLRARHQTLLLIGPVNDIPVELNKDLVSLDLPLPGEPELRDILTEVCQSLPRPITLEMPQEERLARSVLGLTANEARNALTRALREHDEPGDALFTTLVSEKRKMVQGSALLEFFDLDEGLDDIGGLDGLKTWIAERAEAFSSDARARGISNPKGVLLAGIQGCGKSLSARAIARQLGFPLVRMDLSNLLESSRGSSEQNLRDVLHTMETIAPSVLWLEEIDKAFAGFDAGVQSDATIARIVGRFLTWLQEHTAPVFVVATANNIERLPPELLRRGRFDELFFVDLPNFYERRSIYEIHLKRRGWKPELFDTNLLSNRSEGYSGAEIEQVVNSAIIESYSQGHLLTNEDLEQSRDRTVPLSITMEDKIFALREWARTRCRPATIDSRLAQMMDEEERAGHHQRSNDQSSGPLEKWQELARHGQFGGAIIEHVRFHDHVPLDRLVADLSRYADFTGEYGLTLTYDTNMVVWTRISREFADLIISLASGKRVFLTPASPDAYQIRSLELPVIKNFAPEKLNRPVWMPLTLRLIPSVGMGTRLSKLTRVKLGRTARATATSGAQPSQSRAEVESGSGEIGV